MFIALKMGTISYQVRFSNFNGAQSKARLRKIAFFVIFHKNEQFFGSKNAQGSAKKTILNRTGKGV